MSKQDETIERKTGDLSTCAKEPTKDVQFNELCSNNTTFIHGYGAIRIIEKLTEYILQLETGNLHQRTCVGKSNGVGRLLRIK